MSDRNDRDDGAIIGTGAVGGAGGQLIVPGKRLHDPYDDPNGPVPDDEETHDAAEEDEDLMDAGESPEFDHSLRQHKRQ